MSKLSTKGLPLPLDDREFWFKLITDNSIYIRVYSESLNPASIGANSESTQTFTITGLSINDIIYLTPPALDAGIGIMYYRASATDTLQIRYRNFTGGAIDLAAGIYNIIAVRK